MDRAREGLNTTGCSAARTLRMLIASLIASSASLEFLSSLVERMWSETAKSGLECS